MSKPTTLRSADIFPALIGDIGGTNARFQIVRDAAGKLEHFEPVQTADFVSLEDAVAGSVLANTKTTPKSAFIAAAGPITAEGLNLTNCHWTIRPGDVLSHGPLQQLVLLNDFEAQALSLPFLTPDDVSVLGEQHEWKMTDETKVVLGPGTGLGVALLVKAGGRWIPVAGEGGHVDLGPRTRREQEVWAHLEKTEGRVSAEQVICGNGLVNLYTACCNANGVTPTLQTPSEVSTAALAAGQDEAFEALSVFCAALGRVAGDLALTAMARGGVYIAGGISQKILPFLQSSRFRAGFEDKAPHTGLMRSIQTGVVTHPLPALLGLAAYVCRSEAFAIEIGHRVWFR